ncbi:MAG TPA: hypothetical protein VLL82_12405 [Mycobacterium sp.]|nr:hypothetical protein [Mycobacterium sp.]
MTQQQLSTMRCDNPACDHRDHPVMNLIPQCHRYAGLAMSYHVFTGVIQISCNECGGYICDVLVAPAEVQ